MTGNGIVVDYKGDYVGYPHHYCHILMSFHQVLKGLGTPGSDPPKGSKKWSQIGRFVGGRSHEVPKGGTQNGPVLDTPFEGLSIPYQTLAGRVAGRTRNTAWWTSPPSCPYVGLGTPFETIVRTPKKGPKSGPQIGHFWGTKPWIHDDHVKIRPPDVKVGPRNHHFGPV